MALVKSKQLEGGGPSVSPEHIAYVSPGFANVFPYYSTIQAAVAAMATNTIDLIVVHQGDYSVSATITVPNHIHFEEGAVVTFTATSNIPMFSLGLNKYISGRGVFVNSGTNSAYLFRITNGATGVQLQFKYTAGCDSAHTGIKLTSLLSKACTIECDECPPIYDSSTMQVAATLAPTLIVRTVIFDAYNNTSYEGVGKYRSVTISALYMRGGVSCMSGDVTVDFQYASTADYPVLMSVYNGRLTARNGIIVATSLQTGVDAPCLVSNAFDKNACPTLVLEQVSIRSSKKAVSIVSGGADYRAELITKNCTFQTDDYSVSGTDSSYCYLRNCGGNSCASMDVSNVTQLVQDILIDTNVIV